MVIYIYIHICKFNKIFHLSTPFWSIFPAKLPVEILLGRSWTCLGLTRGRRNPLRKAASIPGNIPSDEGEAALSS
jgi:hypothetical protein